MTLFCEQVFAPAQRQRRMSCDRCIRSDCNEKQKKGTLYVTFRLMESTEVLNVGFGGKVLMM